MSRIDEPGVLTPRGASRCDLRLVIRDAVDVVVCGIHDFGQQPADVPAAGPVQLAAAVPAQADQSGEAELGQVMGHGGADDADRGGQGGDVVLVAAEQPRHPHPGGVGSASTARSTRLPPGQAAAGVVLPLQRGRAAGELGADLDCEAAAWWLPSLVVAQKFRCATAVDPAEVEARLARGTLAFLTE